MDDCIYVVTVEYYHQRETKKVLMLQPYSLLSHIEKDHANGAFDMPGRDITEICVAKLPVVMQKVWPIPKEESAPSEEKHTADNNCVSCGKQRATIRDGENGPIIRKCCSNECCALYMR